MSRATPGRPAPPARERYARKRFGQHFLHDQAVIRRIVEAIEPKPDELIVEIGPGRGALSFPLLASGCELHVVEIDRDLAARLRARAPHGSNLVVHEADALKLDLTGLAPPPRLLRVTGNLPYNISTPLLFRLLAVLPRIRDMHLMLQREVVDRMVSPPGARAYGRLSVMVESAVVRLRPRPHATLDPAGRDRFETIVRSCFSRRRKTLRNALRGVCDEGTIAASGLDPQVRPEMLTVDEFVGLVHASMTRE